MTDSDRIVQPHLGDLCAEWVEEDKFLLHPTEYAPRLYWNGKWYWIIARGTEVSDVDGRHLGLVSDDGHAEFVQPLHYRLALEWYSDDDREFEFHDMDGNPVDRAVVNRYGERID